MSVSTININNTQKPELTYQELMTFFNAIDEVYFSVDRVTLQFIRMSESCEKLFGYKAADFFENHHLWLDLIHPDDRHLIDDENIKLNRGEFLFSQYRVIHKDGAVRWIEKKVLPHMDELGKLVRVEGIIRDITVRKKTEEKNRQSEARYRQIVEIAQEGIWTIDEQGKTNFVNQKMAEMLGYTPEEMIGKEPFHFMKESIRAESIARIARRRTGYKEDLDIPYVHKDGHEIWANISSNPIYDASGGYQGMLAMFIDVTRRKLDEEAIRKSEANLRTIFDNTDSSYILISTELKIVSFNALAQKFSEEQNSKMLELNRPIKDYFSEERWPSILETLEKVRSGQTVKYELSFTKSDGSIQWYRVRWLNVRDSTNKNCGFILSNKNFTENKVAALEREKITADLIQHNKDLEQFTYIISHNLRAPVANIIGLSEMLLEEGEDIDEKTEVIERISLSIRSIDEVIQDLNNILQARGLLNEKKQLVYLNVLVDAIRTSIYNKVLSENVKLRCSFDEVDSIFTVPSYLYSIFYNLISNSIKYRQSDVMPIIIIESHKVNDKLVLNFKDNGKGIDLDKNASHIFGLYKRFDTSIEGKGMGLFMVKTQVEALGGTIEIKSQLGQGAEFIIQFPL